MGAEKQEPPMKVVHIDTGKDWRGGQSQVLMLAEGMVNRGLDVVLALRRDGALAKRAGERRLNLFEIPFRFEADPTAALAVARMAGAKGSPTIYHAHTPHALGIAILAQQLGPTWPIVFTRRVAFPLKKLFVTRWKLNKADRLVAVSQAVARELEQGGIHPDKIRVIHSAIDTDKFQYRTGPNTKPPLNIAISASLEAAKGLDQAKQFVENAAGHDFVFHFAGGGADLENMKLWAEGRENVKVHGFVSDMPAFLQNMFALISFSPSEGFPNVILQALVTGLPVLAYDNAAVREMLEHEENGRIFTTHPEALAILQEWKSNIHEVAQRGLPASRRVAAKYSQDMMVEQTLSLYKEIFP
jgi:glycosyltransferase involved in cell wall biosynthesis